MRIMFIGDEWRKTKQRKERENLKRTNKLNCAASFTKPKGKRIEMCKLPWLTAGFGCWFTSHRFFQMWEKLAK
jgi:hypothetical protein